MINYDVTVNGIEFGATELVVSAVSERAKALISEMFGNGAVGVTLKKSTGYELVRFFIQKGLEIEWGFSDVESVKSLYKRGNK